MNRKYIPIYMEIIEFESEDIITTSGGANDDVGYDDVGYDDGEDDFGD